MSVQTKPLDIKVIGMNSGTSMDGVDCAHLHFRQESPDSPLHMKLLNYAEIPLPAWIKKPLLKMIKYNTTTPEELCQVNFQLGEVFADAVLQFCKDKNIDLKKEVDLIGNHGQTIWLLSMPEKGQTKSALTMAEPAVMAAKLGKTITNDFRQAEQAVGRQGAPLAAFIDALALEHDHLNRASQNIGGIGNVAFVPKKTEGGIDQVFDFDTGPGNVFIDAAVRHFTDGAKEYDKDGEIGAKGKVNQAMVDEFLKHPYFSTPPPKTTGRELFGDDVALQLIEKGLAQGMSPEDCVATITRITAQSIVDHYKRYSPGEGKDLDEIYMCGGGAKNKNITKYIQESFPQARLTNLDECGIPADAKEAISFGWMGLDTLLGRSLLIPQRVETQTPCVPGKITPGSNYHELMQQVVDFSRDTKGWRGTNILPPVRKLVIDP